MAKLKSIVFVAGGMVLIFSAAGGDLSLQNLVAILPPPRHEDKSGFNFFPP